MTKTTAILQMAMAAAQSGQLKRVVIHTDPYPVAVLDGMDLDIRFSRAGDMGDFRDELELHGIFVVNVDDIDEEVKTVDCEVKFIINLTNIALADDQATPQLVTNLYQPVHDAVLKHIPSNKIECFDMELEYK